jgi:large subunit ribosomal protein L9
MKRSNRQVSVILNADVDGLGFSGELVTVKAGYARNFLLAGRQGDVATPELLKKREKEIANAQTKREEEVAKLQGAVQALSTEPVKLKLKVGTDNQVFGSITAAELAKAVKTQLKQTVEPRQLVGLPIKALGRHTVSVKLGLGVTGSLELDISPEPVKAPKETAEQPA